MSKILQIIFGKIHSLETMLQYNLGQLNIEVGVNELILDLDYEQYKHHLLTESYARNTWGIMSKHQIKMEIGIKTILLQKEIDTWII